MPRRIGQNLELSGEILDNAKQILSNKPTDLTCNWLPGTDDSMGKVSLQLSKDGDDPAIKMKSNYREAAIPTA
jgi:hypothetical protein